MATINGSQSTDHADGGETHGATAPPSQDQLTNLIAKATALSGIKDYTAAAEIYSQATELQAELNGEMNVDNADLLYAYGRCLFFVAQKTSTVLGGTAAGAQLTKDGQKKQSKKRKANGATKTAEDGPSSAAPDVVPTHAPADVVPETQAKADAEGSDKPFFQFTGDDNYDESDEDEEEGENGEEEEADDDFETSFELLDLARILFLRNLETIEQQNNESRDKGKTPKDTNTSPQTRNIKLRVADIYDLQAEISLEGEKFQAAVSDLTSCLKLKQELENQESNVLAECHYKLSLALEAASQDQERDADGNPVGEITINWDVRNEAIAQQEKAIESCQLRVQKEKEKLETCSDDKEKTSAKEQIEDVEGMIGEMQDRLADLKKPPVNVKAETENDMNKELMAGVLGQIMGASGKTKDEQKEELAKVIAGATDLSGMVKRKKPKKPAVDDETASNVSGTGSKRKMEFVDEEKSHEGKKAKVEEVEDSGQ